MTLAPSYLARRPANALKFTTLDRRASAPVIRRLSTGHQPGLKRVLGELGAGGRMVSERVADLSSDQSDALRLRVVEERSFTFRATRPAIEKATLGNEAGLYGAASLPWQ